MKCFREREKKREDKNCSEEASSLPRCKEKRKEGKNMKEKIIAKGIIALLKVILPALEKRAKESPSPIDDIVIGIIKIIIGMEKEMEEK